MYANSQCVAAVYVYHAVADTGERRAQTAAKLSTVRFAAWTSRANIVIDICVYVNVGYCRCMCMIYVRVLVFRLID